MGYVHWWSSICCVGLLCAAGCGGGEKKTAAPEPMEEVEEDDGEDLIPEEKFEEIKNTFERKATTVARCFPLAVESGEVDQDDRIQVSVGLVIQPNGSASQLEILGSSKRSKTLEACVLESVKRWQFTTLPKPLQYSYGFKLQRF